MGVQGEFTLFGAQSTKDSDPRFFFIRTYSFIYLRGRETARKRALILLIHSTDASETGLGPKPGARGSMQVAPMSISLAITAVSRGLQELEEADGRIQSQESNPVCPDVELERLFIEFCLEQQQQREKRSPLSILPMVKMAKTWLDQSQETRRVVGKEPNP